MNCKKITALLLCVALLLCYSATAFAAEPQEAEDGWVFDTLKEDDNSYKPIPLLVLKINYDADKDGVDGYKSGVSAETMKKNGEQWTHSNDSYWSELCFSDTGKTLKNFYKDVSNGTFYFTPAAETSGTANDGVVTVTIPYKHPQASTGSNGTEDAASRIAAITAAKEFVDFASFDKNGDGFLGRTELAIAFVCGGQESSSYSGSGTRDQFGVHAHYTSGSGAKINGVTVGQSGFIRVGEYVSSDQCLTVGTIAHELGHYLGAADLYDTDHNKDGKTWNYGSDASLMTGGSHNSFSNERRGSSPSYFDPYHLIDLGFAKAGFVGDGTYTLYSHQSNKGDYNIIKVGTPDPGEYYLIENRYGVADNRNFDAISSGSKALLIWHIDEYAISKGRVNNEGSGHDPGIIPLGVNMGNGPGLSMPYGFFYNESANARYYTFDSDRYKFPVSETAYTSLTPEQAENYGLHIDILSPAGNEMQIKITGAATLTPTMGLLSVDSTVNTLTFRATINDLCGGNVTSCGLILSEKPDYRDDPNAKTVYLKPDEYGRFETVFTDLKDNTKYFCTAFTEGSAGRGERNAAGYTKAIPVPRDYYVAHLYRATSTADRSYDVKLKPGEYIPDKVISSMKKSGYVFGGYYTDDQLTERFDLRSTQTELEDITLFAKWIEEDIAATITVHGATLRYGMAFATEIGKTYQEPYILPKTGYVFAGWFTDEALTLPFDFGMAAETTDTLNLYAKWEAEVPTETTGGTTPPVTTGGTTPDATTGTTPEDTTGTTDPKQENGNTVMIVVVVAIAVVAIFAVGGVVYFNLKRKKAPETGADAVADTASESQAKTESPMESKPQDETEIQTENQEEPEIKTEPETENQEGDQA